VGRLIPAGTGYSFHAEQRRTREQMIADELHGLETAAAAKLAKAAEEAEAAAEADAQASDAAAS